MPLMSWAPSSPKRKENDNHAAYPFGMVVSPTSVAYPDRLLAVGKALGSRRNMAMRRMVSRWLDAAAAPVNRGADIPEANECSIAKPKARET